MKTIKVIKIYETNNSLKKILKDILKENNI